VTVVVVPYIPNAFTPNGDGLNDKFIILGIPYEQVTHFNLQIYDRWGQMIYTSNDIREGWDGTRNGENCPEGVYVWTIYYQDNKKKPVTNKGTITLIR
jgi:gliding motility-associated-like protein